MGATNQCAVTTPGSALTMCMICCARRPPLAAPLNRADRSIRPRRARPAPPCRRNSPTCRPIPLPNINEPGPYGGVPGIFLQFTREAHLHYSVSVVAVSSATLTGHLNNIGSEKGDLQLIESTAWDMVVLQDQSFRPLPAMITVMGRASRHGATSPVLKAGWPG